MRLLQSNEDTDSSTVQSRVGRRTSLVVGTEQGTALGSQVASLESDRVRNVDKNILASAVAWKGTWFRHVVTYCEWDPERRGGVALFGCRRLHSTDELEWLCLMDEHIMILIINPYSSAVSSSCTFLIHHVFLFHSPVMAVRYTPSEKRHMPVLQPNTL
jgi:hypothetical protein